MAFAAAAFGQPPAASGVPTLAPGMDDAGLLAPGTDTADSDFSDLLQPSDSTTSSPTTQRPQRTTRSPILRLASVPNMFGDSVAVTSQLQTEEIQTSVADLPLAAGRRVKISENNKALPMDRVFFVYNHFHNVLYAASDVTLPGRDFSLDRYTFGVEKRFCNGQWSVELRMPMVSNFNYASPSFGLYGGDVGNLAVTFKRLLYANQHTAVALGLGVDTPTGSDVTGQVSQTDFTVFNDAVHLGPWVGMLCAPTPRLFYQGFLQVDVPLNGNRIEYVDRWTSNSGSFGRLSEQTLMYVDVDAGYWLYRNQHASCITGLASVLEFHYTTTLQNAQLIDEWVGSQRFEFGNLLNRIDTVQMTVGVHAEIARQTTVRVGGVFPLGKYVERPFDGEVQVTVNRRF